jgi:hypothetical protein
MIAPILSCPGETQGVRLLVWHKNEYSLHLISDQKSALVVPSAVGAMGTRLLRRPFMRDDNTLCAWVGGELFVWDTRMRNAQTYTVDSCIGSPRESSAFATDNIFVSLLSVMHNSILCGTYDLRNVSGAITLVPTRAHAVV